MTLGDYRSRQAGRLLDQWMVKHALGWRPILPLSTTLRSAWQAGIAKKDSCGRIERAAAGPVR
jgi:hypothetical protein